MSDPTSPDLVSTPTVPPQSPRFRLPAEYYAAPAPEARPLVSRGVRIGCGVASLALLLILFAGGAIVGRHGLGKLMDPLLGTMADEMGAMYTKDVTTAQRDELTREITRLREGIRDGRVPVQKLDPVMSNLREAIADQKLTPAETDKLAKLIHGINSAPPPVKTKK